MLRPDRSSKETRSSQGTGIMQFFRCFAESEPKTKVPNSQRAVTHSRLLVIDMCLQLKFVCAFAPYCIVNLIIIS